MPHSRLIPRQPGDRRDLVAPFVNRGITSAAEVLEDEGYRVFRASEGFEAWQLCQRHRPKVVITDVMMPRMDGIELLSRLRNSGGPQQPAMILMSAARQSISHPGVSFEPKPFDLQDVLDKLAACLEEWSSA